MSPLIPGGLFPDGKLPLTPTDWINTAGHLSRSPTRLLLDLVEQVAAQMADEDLELLTDDTDVVLRLAGLRCDHPEPQPFLGALERGGERIERVDLDVRAVRWTHHDGSERRLDHLAVAVHDVRVEPGRRLSLVTGRIDAVATLTPDTVAAWLDALELDHDLRLAGPGLVEAEPRGGSWWRAVVRPHVEGGRVHLPVERVVVWGLGLGVPPRWRGERSVELPELARGARITDLELDQDGVRLHLRIDELREPIALEQLQRALRRAGPRVVLRLADPRQA